MNDMSAAGDGYRLDVLSGCDVGPCPKIGRRGARPGFAIVQGTRVPDAERAVLGLIPAHEEVVELPEDVLLDYAQRMVKEGRLSSC